MLCSQHEAMEQTSKSPFSHILTFDQLRESSIFLFFCDAAADDGMQQAVVRYIINFRSSFQIVQKVFS